MNIDIQQNRQLFLSELRSGRYKKGCIKSDEKGNPLFEDDSDKDGFCCCAIMTHLFGQTKSGKLSLPLAVKALGITNKDCRVIQTEINDRASSFHEDADLIESEIFSIAHRRVSEIPSWHVSFLKSQEIERWRIMSERSE